MQHANINVTGNKNRWEKPGHSPVFGYDYWYQPRHKTMISSSWGAPCAFSKGFDLQHVKDGLYGRHLSVYSWPDGELKQTLDLGESGLLPLEVFFSSFDELSMTLFMHDTALILAHLHMISLFVTESHLTN
jgi:56kDa selenium binding protein (SBP56)